MEKRWFIYTEQVVAGPFDTTEVQSGVEEGKWTEKSLVWWKGQRDWITLAIWQTELERIMQSVDQKSSQAVWYAEQNGQQKGPMTWNSLISHLKGFQYPSDVRIWTVGQEKWAPLFEYEEIIAELGLTRRSFPRAPIVGNVTISRVGDPIKANMTSISEGGLGISDYHSFSKGESVQISIDSPLLVAPVRSNAKVVYVNRGGVTGFQFENMHAESRATVIDYVRQFQDDPAVAQAA